jgi:quinol monooxygenase YgiN
MKVLTGLSRARQWQLVSLAIAFVLYIPISTAAQNEKQLVRLAVIEIDSAQLESYNSFLREEIEASIRIERGVLTLYAVSEKMKPTHVTIFETYADSGAYKAHLATPHFQKYKTGTMAMVKNLDLIESSRILYSRNAQVRLADISHPFVLMTKMEIDSARLQDYHGVVKRLIEPWSRLDKRLTTYYEVAEKRRPTHITILKIFPDVSAYHLHLEQGYILKYNQEVTDMIRSIEEIEVVPVMLGAKRNIEQ